MNNTQISSLTTHGINETFGKSITIVGCRQFCMAWYSYGYLMLMYSIYFADNLYVITITSELEFLTLLYIAI